MFRLAHPWVLLMLLAGLGVLLFRLRVQRDRLLPPALRYSDVRLAEPGRRPWRARLRWLPDVLRLSEGEARGGGAQRPSILADAVEALIGAIYLDGGFAPAVQLVRQLFGELIASTEADSWSKDAKTELQE